MIASSATFPVAILASTNCEALIVLFVRVSVVFFPTNVSVDAGSVTVTSAVAAGPISVALFVPLFVPSKNSILPAVVAVGLNLGSVKVLFVKVSVPVRVTSFASPKGASKTPVFVATPSR